MFLNTDIEKADILDESIHLIITSPPYNVGIKYDTHGDNMPYDEYLSWLTTIFTNLKDKLVTGGRVCVNIAPTGIKNFIPIHHDLITNLRKCGYTLEGEILWYKQNIKSRTSWGSFRSPSCPYVLPSWEYIYVLQKGKFQRDWYKKPDITSEEFVKFTDGFWNIKPETVKRGHPVPFPKELVYRLIKLYTYPHNIVLDPFGGSGTVALVCKETNRNFIYIDISEKYFKLALKNFGVEVECPRCKSIHIKKDGTKNGYQRYKCLNCNRWFSEHSKERDIIFQLRDTSKENIKKHIDAQ